MNPNDFNNFLLETFEDHQFSRKEKKSLKELLADHPLDDREKALFQSKAFDIARESLSKTEPGKVVDWLEEVVKTLHAPSQISTDKQALAEAFFTPGDDCPGKIGHLISSCRKSLDICVFTITDNRLSRPILAAHRRGVSVRIISDDEKMDDAGSDMHLFHREGIPIRIDRTQYHMHHKFALFDDSQVVTGSYNWTRGAAEYNHENFIIVNDQRLLRKFKSVFEKLWTDLKELK